MSDDVTITVRVNNQTAAGMRDVNGQLRSLDGRFATAAGSMSRSSSKANAALLDMKASLLSLAPAAVPVAASLAPIAVQAGAAGLAVVAFGAAVIPQIGNLKDAAAAQTKYSDAVTKYGQRSKQATQAQAQAAQVLKGMPKATQQAAAAYSNLQGKFKSFSDSTARFTMAPVEKSFAILGQVIPKLTPMVKGTSEQLNRLMTVAGGGVSTAAFDTLSKKVGDFANQSLKGATDKVIHFTRVLSEGKARGPIASFFDYARAQGPAVKELLTNVAKAVSNLLEGASQAGPGMLTLVNAFAKLVAALPPSLIANLMQVYAAFKLIKLAGSGVGAVAAGYASLGTRIAALRAASVAAGGGIAGMNAALNTLSTGGKAALALGVVGGLVLAMHKLSGNKGPVAVDALSTSLNTLASTGKVTGALKSNFDDISNSIAMVSKSASDNKFAEMTSDFGTWIGISTGPGISTARKNVDAWDKSMANLVRGGHTKEAAAQYEILKRAWVAGGGDLKRLGKFTDDYKGALADQAFEQKMAADSMGLFGQAAQDAQTKLDAQKSSADGLRQSIQALNDVNRQGLGGMIGFEAAIDAASKAAKDNAGALSMTNGVLNLGSEKARNAAGALQDLADKTDSAAASARESGSSWETVNGIYSRGRSELIKQARAMGLSKEQAAALADQILKIPDKTAKVKMNTEDAKGDLNAFNAAVKRSPGSKSVTLKTLSKSAEAILESFGYKVKRLPNGKVTVSAKTGGALSGIRNIAGAIAALHSKTVTITTNKVTKFTSVQGGVTVAKRDYASGGKVRGYASGGDVQSYPDGGYIEGPGSGTSDSILTMLGSGNVVRSSNTEFIVNARQTAKHRRLLELINSGRLPGFAKGGLTQGEKDARGALRGQFGISSFGRAAGYQRTPFEHNLGAPADINALVSSLNEAAGNIKRATSGRTESRLLRQLDSVGKGLIKYEKQLGSVNASLGKAKDKLDSLKGAASQLADSVKSNILGSSNITRGAQGDAPVTVASIMAGATQSRDKAKSFASALKQLQKKGLDKGLIEDIANAGIEGGGLETAGALLGASGSEIKSLNNLRSQTATYAKQAGGTAADAMYGAAIKSQENLIKNLTKQQDKLEKAMANLAKVMEKAIAKAIGKKAAGGIVGAAASGGIRSGLTWVGEHGPELADLPVGSRVWSNPDSRRKAAPPWASMLNTPRGGGVQRAATPVGGGGQPVVVHQTIELDGRVIARQIFDPLRAEIAHRGGSVQKTMGQGAR